jgi:hypothetical protein
MSTHGHTLELHGKRYEITPVLRIVVRDGERVLQQLHYALDRPTGPVWLDVQVGEDDPKPTAPSHD